MIVFSFTIVILYGLLIGSFIFGFDRVKMFKLNKNRAKTKFSVVIPFRNEAENLPSLLQSITLLNYPKHLFEIILVDDASDDDSLLVIQKVLDTLTQNENKPIDMRIIENVRTTLAPKKDAITTAIQQAKYEWIITTDADCTLPKFWLDSFDGFIQRTKPVCVVAPVTFSKGNLFLNRFQMLEFFSLQGATIGGFGIDKPFLCNGANFAYTKTAFKKVDGFEGNTNLASGDDIFLLEKLKKTYPKAIKYLKSPMAIVTTKPQNSWKSLVSQRIRWTSKTSKYNNWFGKLVGTSVFLMNLSIIVLPILLLFDKTVFTILGFALITKLTLDFILLYKSSAFFNNKLNILNFSLCFFVYPFFSTFVAVVSFFKGYNWKGRTFNV
ncbi:MAG: glycosyltransferase [Jejuia sp.]